MLTTRRSQAEDSTPKFKKITKVQKLIKKNKYLENGIALKRKEKCSQKFY